MTSYGAFGVDLDGLAQTATGIQGIIDKLNGLGMSGEADTGAAIKNLKVDKFMVGHEGLTDGINDFIDQIWQFLHIFLSSAYDTAHGVMDTRNAYEKTEEYVQKLFFGNPDTGPTQSDSLTELLAQQLNPTPENERPENSTFFTELSQLTAQKGAHKATLPLAGGLGHG